MYNMYPKFHGTGERHAAIVMSLHSLSTMKSRHNHGHYNRWSWQFITSLAMVPHIGPLSDAY